jgi:hypothetical protein
LKRMRAAEDAMDTVEHNEKRPQPVDDKRGAAKKPLRARPVKGPIDHEALSREFIAKYPKLRAALAK